MSGQRYFTEADVLAVLGAGFADSPRRLMVYWRVSSAGQRDDLASQVAAMESFCVGRGLAVSAWISEVGGGMNFRRRKFLQLLDHGIVGEVSMIVVAHRDRLVGFGFELIDGWPPHMAARSWWPTRSRCHRNKNWSKTCWRSCTCSRAAYLGLGRYEKQLRAEGPGLSVAADTVPI